MKTFAERLRSAREAVGMSQARLAKLVGHGLTQQAIGQMEDPKKFRKGSAFVPELANVLFVEALWLATGNGPRNRNDFTRNMTETRQYGDQMEERMKAGLPKIVEGLCLVFTEDAVRAELQRYEERKANEKRPPETATAS